MNDSDFKGYLEEYQSEGIGTRLYSLILGIVDQTARRYPHAFYSPNGVWDEDAISGLCQDFTMEKLLKAGWLEHYLLTLENAEQFKKVLIRDFRHFLISQRTRSEYFNLIRRLKKMLLEDSLFKNCFASGPNGTWGLHGWDQRDSAQHLDEVVNAMFTVQLPPLVKYRAESKKLSHLIGNDDLRRLIQETLYQLNQCVGFDLLADGLRYRLNLFDIDEISLDDPIDGHSNESSTYADIIKAEVLEPNVDLKPIADSIFERLSDRQRQILALYLSLNKVTLVQLSKQLRISKSSVYNDLRAIEEYIASANVPGDEAEEVFSILADQCMPYIAQIGENTK